MPHSKLTIGAEALDELYEIKGVQATRDDFVPRVVDQVVAVDRGQPVELTDDATTQRSVVRNTHVAVAAGIDNDAALGGGQRNSQGEAVEQHLGVDAIDTQMHGHDEQRRVVSLTVCEALLAEHQLVPIEPGRDERVPGLPDPAVHECAHRRAGVGFLDGVPQITGFCVRVLVLRQVVADPSLEGRLAQVLLQHAQQRPTLLVRQYIEHAIAIGGCLDKEFDGASAGQRVDFECGTAFQAERRPALPVRAVRVATGDLHEGGERLVQPNSVPPLHGHQVAEPHVRHLVRNHIGQVLQLELCGGGRVGQQQALAVRNGAEVLHRTGGEVGERQHVALIGGVGDAVVVLIPAQRVSAHVQPEGREMALAGHMDDS